MPATVQRFSAASADPHILHQHLLASGVVIIEGAATRSTIDDILAEIAENQSQSQSQPQPEAQTFALAAKSPTFATQLLMNPLYMDLAKRILTDTAIIYYEQDRTVSISEPQVSATEILTAVPGAQAWGLRRRDECHHITHPAKRESDVGIMYAATDVTAANGAVRVVVGSNWWVDERDPAADEEVRVEMRKGDALVWLGSTYYGRAANSTADETSILLGAIAIPGYLRQEENQYLAVPWEGVAETYPTAVQQFLGYSVSRPYGGAVEHMEPLDYLKVKGDWSKYVPVDLI
ncbi:hypothetical protein ASPCAL06982 [Aspergillus calidoustus]|uniref:Phytanoyl-CoA dioxygenase family protein n=1 Tax=Aspergillus calidoustus TaxID=454130 RepID=A0A0U5G5K9_ASPCI|nr:hypothetical protein ASPCAL06982 [Aspergillus calidoustus]